MENLNITSEPSTPAKTTPPKKRRKRRTAAQIARDHLKAAQVRDALAKADTPVIVSEKTNVPFTHKDSLSQVKEKAPEPIGPSPAVLKLQDQVVELVNQRSASRQRITQAHSAYLVAQASFQAMQGELQGIEAEVQYRIQLIAQLENRAPQAGNLVNFPPAQFSDMGNGLMGVPPGLSVEPTVQQRSSSQGDTGDLINRGHAAALRAQI